MICDGEAESAKRFQLSRRCQSQCSVPDCRWSLFAYSAWLASSNTAVCGLAARWPTVEKPTHPCAGYAPSHPVFAPGLSSHGHSATSQRVSVPLCFANFAKPFKPGSALPDGLPGIIEQTLRRQSRQRVYFSSFLADFAKSKFWIVFLLASVLLCADVPWPCCCVAEIAFAEVAAWRLSQC
jgi:hypothetical protein